MKRIVDNSAVPDMFGPGKPGFTDGDAASGIQATNLNAAWFNGAQEAPIRVIERRGWVLSDDPSQFADAIDDISLIRAVAAGTANALSIAFTPAIVLDRLTHGRSFLVRAAAPNTAAATLAIDAIAARPIVKGSNAALVAGDIAGAGHWLELQYDVTLGKFVLQNPATGIAPQSLPVGTIIDHSGTAAPPGFLVCPTAPSPVSRAAYAALFAAIGTAWGAGDGATTFSIPWFPADQVGVQANGNVGTNTSGEVKAHNHTAGASNSMQGGPNETRTTVIGSVVTSTTGGPNNLAAGQRVLKCVKF